jgi:hypothetical protein
MQPAAQPPPGLRRIENFVGGSTRRERRRRATVVDVSAAEPLHFRVEVDRASAPISGEVHLDGSEPRLFAGWTELFIAIERALADAQQPEEDP